LGRNETGGFVHRDDGAEHAQIRPGEPAEHGAIGPLHA